MWVYISGPISNMPDLNRTAFARAASFLNEGGCRTVNPFDVCPAPKSWEDAMRSDIRALMKCDAIALLPGWENSRGAKLEKLIADALGMQVMFVPQEAA